MEAFQVNLANYLSFLMPGLSDGRLLGGTLRLEFGVQARTFVFRDGYLVAASSSDPAEHLAQVLSDLGVLDAHAAAAAFDEAHVAKRPFGELLVERGLIQRARLLEVLEYKARESFFDCYTWEAGELQFSTEVPPLRGVELQLEASSLHRDALARLREWKAFREVFPDAGVSFDVFRDCMSERGTRAEEALLAAAERGATRGELLASSREGTLWTARRILSLYRHGVLSPKTGIGDAVGASAELAEILELARSAFEEGEFERAAEFAARALERAPLVEAHALYREAMRRLALALGDKASALEGRLAFGTLPRPAPPELTADDLYLYGKLKGARSVREALREAAMGELAAWRSLGRLRDAGLLWETNAPSTVRRRQTQPLFEAPRIGEGGSREPDAGFPNEARGAALQRRA